MTNTEINATTVDNNQHEIFPKGDACEHVVGMIVRDGLNPRIRQLQITVHTQTGKKVVVTFPNDLTGKARVSINGNEV